MMQQTSIEAYKATKNQRETWEAAVLNEFRAGGGCYSDRDVSIILGKQQAFISARRNALIRKGLIRPAGKKLDPLTNMMVNTWAVAR